VVGRLRVVHEGKDSEWSLFTPARIIVGPAGGRDASIHEMMRKDGLFFWSLNPGQYTLVGAAFRKPGSMTEGQLSRTVRIAASFTVPPDAGSVYIGTIKVESLPGGYDMTVEDDYSQALAGFRDKFSGAAAPTRALMQLEDRPGTYQLGQYVCAEEWGIECTGKYHGIIPDYPPVETDAFPLVDGPQPTFKWQPSSRADVSYDFVLYQAVAYRPAGLMTLYLPGAVMDYHQGLEEPRYQPSTPLQPDSRYYWTVRLRRDGTVSNWSSFSYFQFMIFAARSGHSPWFGFSTPPATGEPPGKNNQ
jgi:hypothetical protein